MRKAIPLQGNIRFLKNVDSELYGKDVLIVEDIIDTGLTIKNIVNRMKADSPKSLSVCTLIDRYDRRRILFNADYVCHQLQDTDTGFLVGYGLDYAEHYRNLTAIYSLQWQSHTNGRSF